MGTEEKKRIGRPRKYPVQGKDNTGMGTPDTGGGVEDVPVHVAPEPVKNNDFVKITAENTEKRIGKGLAGPGRPKGSLNAVTSDIVALVRDSIPKVGGLAAFAEWGRKNQTEYWKLIFALAPKKMDIDLGGEVTIRDTIKEVIEERGRAKAEALRTIKDKLREIDVEDDKPLLSRPPAVDEDVEGSEEVY